MIRPSIGTIWMLITRMIMDLRPRKSIRPRASAARNPMTSEASAVALTTIRLFTRLPTNRGCWNARVYESVVNGLGNHCGTMRCRLTPVLNELLTIQ